MRYEMRPLDISVGYWTKNHVKLLTLLKEKNVMHQEIPKSSQLQIQRKLATDPFE
jgi:hypothetical protein